MTTKIMNSNEYQVLAQRTANYSLDLRTRLAAAGLGLAGEAGEVADLIKKHIAHNHSLDREEIIKELGDLQWYIAEVATLLGVTLEEVQSINIDKLKKRYPEGFDEERSKNRSEEDQ